LPAVVVDGMLTSTTSVARVSLGAKEVVLVRWVSTAKGSMIELDGHGRKPEFDGRGTGTSRPLYPAESDQLALLL
jgi:hypothetical protein